VVVTTKMVRRIQYEKHRHKWSSK